MLSTSLKVYAYFYVLPLICDRSLMYTIFFLFSARWWTFCRSLRVPLFWKCWCNIWTDVAEAAGRRYGTDQPLSASRDAAVHSLPANEIPTLRFLVIKFVTASICSARQTYTGLHGLPSSLALQILAHIVKEGLLRPKTLHAFISW